MGRNISGTNHCTGYQNAPLMKCTYSANRYVCVTDLLLQVRVHAILAIAVTPAVTRAGAVLSRAQAPTTLAGVCES